MNFLKLTPFNPESDCDIEQIATVILANPAHVQAIEQKDGYCVICFSASHLKWYRVTESFDQIISQMG